MNCRTKQVDTDDLSYDDDGLKPGGVSLSVANAIKNADSWGYFAADLVGALSDAYLNEVYKWGRNTMCGFFRLLSWSAASAAAVGDLTPSRADEPTIDDGARAVGSSETCSQGRPSRRRRGALRSDGGAPEQGLQTEQRG